MGQLQRSGIVSQPTQGIQYHGTHLVNPPYRDDPIEARREIGVHHSRVPPTARESWVSSQTGGKLHVMGSRGVVIARPKSPHVNVIHQVAAAYRPHTTAGNDSSIL